MIGKDPGENTGTNYSFISNQPAFLVDYFSTCMMELNIPTCNYNVPLLLTFTCCHLLLYIMGFAHC